MEEFLGQGLEVSVADVNAFREDLEDLVAWFYVHEVLFILLVRFQILSILANKLFKIIHGIIDCAHINIATKNLNLRFLILYFRILKVLG